MKEETAMRREYRKVFRKLEGRSSRINGCCRLHGELRNASVAFWLLHYRER